MRVQIVLAASFLALTLCGQVNGQAVSEQEMRKRVAALEQENRALKAQMQMQQKELEEVRAALAKAKQEAALPEVAASQPGTGGGGNIEGGTGRPAGERVYQDVMQMLRELPSDLMPNPATGWDKYTLPKATRWLEDRMTGARFESRLALATSPKSTRTLSDKEDWMALLTPVRVRTRFVNMDVVQVVDGLRLYGDETFARRVDEMESGHVIRFRGRIQKLEVRGTGSSTEIRLSLGPWDLLSPELQGARTVAK